MINSKKNQTKTIRGRDRTCDREIKNNNNNNNTKIYQSKLETLKNNTKIYQSIWVHLSSFGFTLVHSVNFIPLQSNLVQFNHFGPFNPIQSTSSCFGPFYFTLVHFGPF